MILSFDTSNYTTSACLFDSKNGVVWQNRILLHPSENQRGLRQNDVVFLHIKNLETLLNDFPKNKITAVVASERPRPVATSYMPCFLVGKNYAKALSQVLGCPFASYSHQENHIMAALYSSGQMQLTSAPFIAMHISGGTSDILLLTPSDSGLTIEEIGGSLDLHAGQLIDRVGVKLGLEFPCGKEIERVAATANESIPIKTAVCDFQFHFSGFENKANDMIDSGVSAAIIAKFVLDCVLKTLDKVIDNLNKNYNSMPILLAGGVMSNRYIADELKKKHTNLFFSDPFYSSDHALGNAVLYSFLHKN